MAVTSRPLRPRQHFFWSRLHFGIRLLGLTGALVACVAAVLAGIRGELNGFRAVASVQSAYQECANYGQTALDDPSNHVRALCLVLGVLFAVFAVMVELVVVLGFSATRRSAFGFNALLQGALAVVLLVAVNVWSFQSYERIDCTREGQFTLPPEIRSELAQLDPRTKTTILVYQRHKSFGTLNDKPQDDFESTAERVVIEKVRDLADLLRATSSQQLNVEVLDTQAKNYKFQDRLEELTKNAPELRQAIEKAPESSIFFYATVKGKPSIQRLSFNNFYLLDKTASQDDRNGRGNLVLLDQGLAPFIQRLTHLEEKKPRIGLAVIHPVLSSARDHDLGLSGLRRVLEERGFEVKDIVLKKWGGMGPPTAAASTVDESALERLDERQSALETATRSLEREIPSIKEQLAEFQKAITDAKKRDELSRRFSDQLRGEKLTVEDVQLQVQATQFEVENMERALTRVRDRLAKVKDEKSNLNVTALREQQRMTDVGAKLSRLLDDCDLLIVPRMTLRNVAERGDNIPNVLYQFDDPQAEAVKDYLRAGKPLLACFGPMNTSPEVQMQRPGSDQPDALEKLLGEFGIQFGKQTVLFDSEVEAFANSRADAELGGSQLEPPPPVLFDWKVGVGRPFAHRTTNDDKPNRLRRSLQVTARALGRDSEGKPIPLNVRIRHPRPIYYAPPKGTHPEADPVFLMSDASSWNEEQPFSALDTLLQSGQAKNRGKNPLDPEVGKDSLDARRRGPFPIGVAIEAHLPANWYGSSSDKSSPVRIAAIGQGGFFTGKSLPPAEERLFVNTIDWLLGRDDELPVAERVWSYPRVNDTIPPESETEYLWLWGVRLGLPVLFAFLGFVVLLFRRLR